MTFEEIIELAKEYIKLEEDDKELDFSIERWNRMAEIYSEIMHRAD